LPPGYEITKASGPAASLRVASLWIRDCVTKHSCGSTGTEQPLPSRLVQIGRDVRDLKLSNTSGKRGRYLCLSHCWGVKRTFETTSQNITEYLQKLTYDDMPPIYKEAVSLTKMLGISYLWIDSLCIVQDDRNDWLHEAAQMADIYTKCFLTLAATKGASSAASMFHDHCDDEVVGITDEGLPSRILSRPYLSHPGVEIHELLGEEKEFPLLSRGWVFQERLLSPRILHFGPQCGGSREMGLSKAGHAKLLADGSDEELKLAWWTLMEQYSTKKLTRSTDKLPALSGVAKQFAQRRPNSTYLAGLWTSSLLDDMLWISGENGYEEKIPKPQKWRAPSWSWA
jgi:hypothetical protein